MLTGDDLRDVDEQLLEYLGEGRVTPRYARARLEDDVDEYSRGYVQQRLARLEEHSHVENLLGLGLYELVEDPRGDTEVGEARSVADPESAKRAQEEIDRIKEWAEENPIKAEREGLAQQEQMVQNAAIPEDERKQRLEEIRARMERLDEIEDGESDDE